MDEILIMQLHTAVEWDLYN